MPFLKWLWEKWLPIAQAVGNFQAQLIMTLFYFVIILPLGVSYRFFADPFRLRKKIKSNFESWEHPKQSLEESKKQY